MKHFEHCWANRLHYILRDIRFRILQASIQTKIYSPLYILFNGNADLVAIPSSVEFLVYYSLIGNSIRFEVPRDIDCTLLHTMVASSHSAL